MDHPILKEAHFPLIRRLGERDHGHPYLHLRDIAWVGLWGEWHMSGTGGQFVLQDTTCSIRTWLPGKRSKEPNFSLPRGMPAGSYEVAVGIVDPRTRKPEVRIAIEGGTPQKWYSLSRLTVE